MLPKSIADLSLPKQPNALRFTPKHAARALTVALSIYCVLLVTGFVLAGFEQFEAIALAFIHAGGAIALLVFWRTGRWGRARYDCFGAVLLLVAAAFRVHALVDALFYGTRVQDIYVYRNVPMPGNVTGLFLKAELITVLGVLLVACGWRLTIGNRIEQFSFRHNLHQVPIKLPLLVYLSSLGVDALRRIIGIEFGSLTQIMTLLFVFGVASIYFVAASRATRFRRVITAVIMAIPMTALALNSGMKEEMFFPLIPAAYLFWIGYKGMIPRGTAVAVGFSVLALSQLYVHYVREATWRGDGDLVVSPINLAEGFVSDIGSMHAKDAFDAISSRINLTTTHAVTVTLADHHGFEPKNVFGMIPASFVPRLFWPGKPAMQPGARHTARILGVDTSLSEIRSATAAGFATELYLGGWWFGVAIGASLYGFLLAAAQRWTLARTPGFGHLAFCFITMYWTLRFDERAVVYAYTSIIFAIVFLWVLTRTGRLIGISSRKQVVARHG